MQIEQALVGYLIGKGGESLKAIQAQSGATLHIDQSNKDLGVSIIRIIGNDHAVLSARTLVERKISDAKSHKEASAGDAAAADSVAFEVKIEQSFVGFFIGRGGEQVKRIKAQTGATVVIDQSTKDLGYSIVRIMAGPGVEAAKAHIENRLEQAKEANLQNMAPGTANEMMIPQPLVGWVIGRNGESLRQIKQSSGATLVLNQDTKAQGYSVVRFAGDPAAVAKAKGHIQRKLTEVEGKATAPQPPAKVAAFIEQQPPSLALLGNASTNAAIQALAALLSGGGAGIAGTVAGTAGTAPVGQAGSGGTTARGSAITGGVASSGVASSVAAGGGVELGGSPTSGDISCLQGLAQVLSRVPALAGNLGTNTPAPSGALPLQGQRLPAAAGLSTAARPLRPATLAVPPRGQGLPQHLAAPVAPPGLERSVVRAPLPQHAVHQGPRSLGTFSSNPVMQGLPAVQAAQAQLPAIIPDSPGGLPLPGATTVVRPRLGGDAWQSTLAAVPPPLHRQATVAPPPTGNLPVKPLATGVMVGTSLAPLAPCPGLPESGGGLLAPDAVGPPQT